MDIQACLPALVALALCVHLGYAFSYNLLAPELRPYRLLMMPLAGCALFLIITSALTILTSLTPPHVATGLSLLVLPVNGWTWWRHRASGGRLSASEGERPSSELLHVLLCYGLSALVFFLAILPVLQWGVALPIGSNWDAVEFYIPLGRALQLASQRDIPLLPQNPLVQTLSTPPVSGRIHAFSYLHAAASSATGIDPLTSYPAMMAFVLALQPLAVYPLSRMLRLPWGAAILATTLVALAWLPLWVGYNNFSNHLMALPLLSIALGCSVLALRVPGRLQLGSGALFTAGLATAYYPAMTAYLALFAPAALYLLWLSDERMALVWRGMRLGLLAFALSGMAQVYFFLREGFLAEMIHHANGFQIGEFVGLADALGLVATFNRESVALDAWLVTIAVIFALLLGCAALIERRARLLSAMAFGAMLYQLSTALLSYYYGFYKGVTFEIPLYAILIAAGAASLWHLSGMRPWGGRIVRGLVSGGVLLILGLNISTIWGVQQRYTVEGPQLWKASEMGISALRKHVTSAASVLVVPSHTHHPTFNSLVSYVLLGHELFGQYRTGYGAIDNLPGSRSADLALLSEDIDAANYGYTTTDVRWVGNGMRLYGLTPGIRYHQELGSGGRYPSIAPGAELRLHVGPDIIVLSDTQPPPSGSALTAQLTLAIASFEPTTIELNTPTVRERYELVGGITQITSPALMFPAEIFLHNTGEAAAYLWWGELRDATAPVGVVSDEQVFVQVLPQPSISAARASAAIQLRTQRLPEGWQKLTALVVVAHSAEHQGDWQEIGQRVFFPTGARPLHLTIDLADLTMTLLSGDQPADLVGSVPPAGDGHYQATLLLANNAQIVYGTMLWRWQVRDGVPGDIIEDPVFFQVVRLPEPATIVRVDSYDGTMRLCGYTLSAQQVQVGTSISLELVWQSLHKIEEDLQAHVTLRDESGRILVAQRAQIGSSQHGTSTWQEGEIAEQPYQLRVPAATPRGRSLLALELLGADGRPRPFAHGQGWLHLADVEILR